MNSPSRQPLSLLCIHSSTVVCPGAHTKEITFPALAEPVCQQNFTFSPYCYLRWWIVTTSSSPFPFHNPNTIALKYALIVCMHSCNPHSSKPSLVLHCLQEKSTFPSTWHYKALHDLPFIYDSRLMCPSLSLNKVLAVSPRMPHRFCTCIFPFLESQV